MRPGNKRTMEDYAGDKMNSVELDVVGVTTLDPQCTKKTKNDDWVERASTT